MGRENCDFNTYMLGKTYCDYFDFGCFECSDVHRCPNGLDDEEDEEDYYEDELDESRREDETYRI